MLVIITAALCWCIAAEAKRPTAIGEKNRYKYPKK